ncbi:MAG TPA: S-adenosylmethionine:tRNA ribosyltransferase-isomerase, partial [Puia sp.]|nr:S-adenosylmethionine:tRNA ribosyltransferase-isomerase [Puia sp.]
MTKSTSFPDELFLSEFGYDLPDEKIARFPLEQRENSKLLVWKGGRIEDGVYSKLPGFLPISSMLVFNDSRVVEARILFKKPSGGQIEIFCLEPHFSYKSIAHAMEQTGSVKWTCLIGGASKWKHGQILRKKINETVLEARFIEKRTDDFTVEFSWTPAYLPFASVLNQLGTIPLPPYLKRTANSSDAERYQTIYAKESGSVAAPTAGLHFSDKLLRDLSDKGIQSLFLTLHVGAGTFMPVKTEKISDHHMHEEYIEVQKDAVEKLISQIDQNIIAVGTTSLRTLETLYWLGFLISLDKNISAADLHLDQWIPYTHTPNISAKEALHFLLEW